MTTNQDAPCPTGTTHQRRNRRAVQAAHIMQGTGNWNLQTIINILEGKT